MEFLRGREEREATRWMNKAAEVAQKASCLRSKCGTVIVRDGEIVGEGYNSPAGEQEDQRRCLALKDAYHKKVTDKTCCVHAEQRAIMDALRKNPEKVSGSRLYFIRLNEGGNPGRAGKPYCTVCSKMALDAGIAEFVLWHERGICAYGTGEYNLLSYEYSE
jgi:deoxycytidylate deaminase